MKTLQLFFAVSALCITASTVSASITTGDLVNSVVNHLEDNDFEGGFLANGTTLEPGDTLFGIFRIQELNAPAGGFPVANDAGIGAGTTFTGAFATTVLTKDTVPGGFEWTFGPAAPTTWMSIFGGYAPSDTGTMISVFQDSSSPRIVDGVPATAVDGTPLWEFGFTGIGGAAASGESWDADAPFDAPLDLNAQNQGSFTNGLNETANFTSVVFAPHDYLDFGSSTDLQGTGAFYKNPTPSVFTPLVSDTDFFVLPVPEPVSAVVWGVLGLASCLTYRRRRA